jgi:hypothetical protein
MRLRGLQAVALTSALVTAALAMPSVAAAWELWVTPRVVHRPGSVTVHTSTSRRCSVVVRLHRSTFHGHMRHSLTLSVGTAAPLGRAKVTVTCGDYYANAWFSVVMTALSTPTPILPPTPTPTGCYPLTDSGSCYEPGEYCRVSDYGTSGVAGDGEAITCEYNNGWRWEPI